MTLLRGLVDTAQLLTKPAPAAPTGEKVVDAEGEEVGVPGVRLLELIKYGEKSGCQDLQCPGDASRGGIARQAGGIIAAANSDLY